ncbi:hypothetical protein MRB53_040023 [Persea americana]|nr:hypothetical protein MRB53_040023 [Persea americana]
MYDSVWQDQTEQQIGKATKRSDRSNITEADALKLPTDVTSSLPDPMTEATGPRWSGTDLPPPLTKSKTAISYIFRTLPQRGAFDPKKALEFGSKRLEIP